MGNKEWLERLSRTFMQDGLVGGGLTPLLEAEEECGRFVVGTFHGQLVLSDSFEAFFMDTLHLAETRYRGSAHFQTLQWYAYLLLLGLANLRTVRAAEILFTHGRASQGYGLLRDLKDRAVLLGAVGNQFTTLSAISGLDNSAAGGDSLAVTARVKNSRKKAEAGARARMIGPQSGLTSETRTQFRKWEEFFHLEVHGARVTSLLEDGAWIKGKELLPILPKPNMDSLANYMNRFSEVCWMVLRTFPVLQLEPRDFGPEWAEKWRILDESFRAMVDGLQQQGKPIASAIIELMAAKFAFDPDSTTYPPEQ